MSACGAVSASIAAPPGRCGMPAWARARRPARRSRTARLNGSDRPAPRAATHCEESFVALKRPPRPPSPGEMWNRTRESQFWRSVFRPGSIYRPGYRDTSRDRALAMMNNVLYHLHPVKVKRHGLKLTYTFCLGGLSFFLFILLTIT